jgi:hypothetical protein
MKGNPVRAYAVTSHHATGIWYRLDDIPIAAHDPKATLEDTADQKRAPGDKQEVACWIKIDSVQECASGGGGKNPRCGECRINEEERTVIGPDIDQVPSLWICCNA